MLTYFKEKTNSFAPEQTLHRRYKRNSLQYTDRRQERIRLRDKQSRWKELRQAERFGATIFENFKIAFTFSNVYVC